MTIPTPTPRASRGQKAARLCLFAPLLMLAMSFALRGRLSAEAQGAFLSLVVAVLILSLGLGVYALVSMRRHGRQGILAKSIVGILLSGTFLFAFASVMLALRDAIRVRDQMSGTWTRAVDPTTAPAGDAATRPASSSTMTLAPDGGATIRIADGLTTRAALVGRWRVDAQKWLWVDVTRVDAGDQAAAGRRLRLGSVVKLEPERMTLRTDSGDEQYERAK